MNEKTSRQRLETWADREEATVTYTRGHTGPVGGWTCRVETVPNVPKIVVVTGVKGSPELAAGDAIKLLAQAEIEIP